MSDQLPVEVRWGVSVNGILLDIECDKDGAAEIAAQMVHEAKQLGYAKVVEVEIRSLHQPPCWWENIVSSKFSDWFIDGDGDVLIRDIGKRAFPREAFFQYCPMCGRKLEEDLLAPLEITDLHKSVLLEWNTADVGKLLEAFAAIGCCPALLNNDNGGWMVSCESFTSNFDPREDSYYREDYIEHPVWHPTVDEAVWAEAMSEDMLRIKREREEEGK